MTLKTYALAVSLASTVGLLTSIVPLARAALEYRMPGSIDPKPELASLETFVIARGKMGVTEDMWDTKELFERSKLYTVRFWDRDEWQVMYDATKNQQARAARLKATRDLVAYGILVVLCVGLAIIHVGWARRIASKELE